MAEELALLQSLIDADDHPVFALDRDLRYTAFNRAHAAVMRALYGAEIELGGCLIDYQTVAADREAALSVAAQVFAGEAVVVSSHSGEGAQRRFFDIVHTPRTDDAGAVTGVLVRARAWPSRVSARSSTPSSTRAASRASPTAACCTTTREARRLRVSLREPVLSRLTGLRDVLGKRVTEAVPALRDETPELFDIVGTVARTGAPAELDVDFSPRGLWLHVTVLRPEPDHFVAVFSDLTESKRAEQTLATTVARLNEAQSVAAIGSWEWDLETDQVWWSDETYRVFGVSPDEFVPSFEANGRFIHPDDSVAYGASFEHSLKTGEPLDYVFRLKAGDGRQKYCSARGRTVRDADGRPIRFVGTVMDVTGSRRTEEKLRASEEDFRTLAEAVPQIVWMTDADGKNTFFNQQWVEYTGMTLEESYGDGWNTPFHPDDRQRAWEAWQRATQDVAPYSLECRLRRADGVYRWWLIRGAPLRDETGKILKWFGTCTDIEEIKLAEEKLRRSERNLAEAERIGGTGSWDYDVVSDTASWSENMFRIFDVDPAMPTELVFTQFVENLVHPADRPRVLSVFQDSLDGKRPYDLQYRVVKKDGSIRDIHAVAETTRDENGNAVRMIGRVEDVTERRRAEDEVRRLNAELEDRVASRTAQLEAANRELEAFIYSASHDLRAPLRAIDGFSQMVIEDADGRLTAEDADHLQRVRVAAQRLGLLMDELLDLSRASREELFVEDIDVSSLATDVVKELHEAQPERSVEVVVQDDLRAKADAALVRAILVNLLDNAWKFTREREAAHVEVGRIESDGERAFFVRDDGVGFDTKSANRLFGAFQRMHAPGAFEGTGIGLATVQRLVARHGGRVWAEADVEKGATFFFTLPGDAEDPV